nr:exodeoxyribonuclease small subunit [Salmonella sp. NCTC 7297]
MNLSAAYNWRVQGQAKLQQAEQRVQILLSDNEEASPEPFIADNE